ncbi:hypothetical protein Tco_0367554 [Tanacetum coccineum]
MVESVVRPVCWTEVESSKYSGPELITPETTEKIIQSSKGYMQTAPQTDKRVTLNLKLKQMEFQVGDKSSLRSQPWKGVVKQIVGREVKRLKRSRIPLVKVRWNSMRGPEFTWEREDQFKKKYPHLFTETTPSSSVAL